MNKKAGVFLVMLCFGIASLMSQKEPENKHQIRTEPLQLCAADQYLNKELYSTWTDEAKLGLNVTEAVVGFGIGLVCPIVGLGYAL